MSGQPRPRHPTHGGPAASGSITATCNLQQAASRVDVALTVENSTGATITNLAPANPSLQVEANTDFVLSSSSSPPAYATVRDGRAVTFLWRGRFNSPGAVGISVTASAAGSSGATIRTSLVDCGTATQVARSRHPVRTAPAPPTPTPPPATLQGEAAQCAACHENPQMAFVANKWVQSKHANSYGVSEGNTFCAQCHSPFQADANASATNNKTIPLQVWQAVTCSSCHPSADKEQEWGTPIATYDIASQTYAPVALENANQLCFHCHNGPHAARFDGPGLRMMQSGVRCIDCHMATIPSGQENVPDTATHDLKVEANLPASCGIAPGGCHGGGTKEWAVEEIRSGAIHGSH